MTARRDVSHDSLYLSFRSACCNRLEVGTLNIPQTRSQLELKLEVSQP
jgi:hypothetical protein